MQQIKYRPESWAAELADKHGNKEAHRIAATYKTEFIGKDGQERNPYCKWYEGAYQWLLTNRPLPPE